MNNFSVNGQYNSNKKCDICDNQITYQDFLSSKELEYLVCSSSDCKKVMSQKSNMTPFQFENYFSFQKKHILNLREQNIKRKKRFEKMREGEKAHNQKILCTFLDQNPRYSENEVRLVRLPSGLKELIPISAERIDKYSEHLNTIIHEAVENLERNIEVSDQNNQAKENLLSMEQRFSEIPNLQIMADKFCGMCKGGCCPAGDNHAYLSSTSIMQLMIDIPELTTNDIHEMYLSKVNKETVKGACINQTKLGCSLPREMRSNICNAYFCPPVKSYLLDNDLLDEENTTQVIVVQWSNTNWNRLDPNVDNEIVDVSLISEAETV